MDERSVQQGAEADDGSQIREALAPIVELIRKVAAAAEDYETFASVVMSSSSITRWLDPVLHNLGDVEADLGHRTSSFLRRFVTKRAPIPLRDDRKRELLEQGLELDLGERERLEAAWSAFRSLDPPDKDDVLLRPAVEPGEAWPGGPFRSRVNEVASDVVAGKFSRGKMATDPTDSLEDVDRSRTSDESLGQLARLHARSEIQLGWEHADLTPSEEDVLRYRFLRDLSVEETAARMQTSEDAVYTHTSRALKKLREALRDSPFSA